MHPTLFNLGPLPIRSYGFMMMLGFLVSIHLAARRARRCGADEELILNLGLISLIVGIMGARFFYVVHYLPTFLKTDNPLFAAINLTSGGLEFYGGFLAAVVVIIVYLRLKKRSIRWYLDILAPSIMLGLAFGRIGCFLNGCCWGAPTKMPWAITFPYGSLPFEHQWLNTYKIAVPGEFILTTGLGEPFLIKQETLKMSDEQLRNKLAKAGPAAVGGGCRAGDVRYLGMVKGHLDGYGVTLADLKELVRTLNLKSLPVHPTQLYSCANALLISWILSLYFWRRRRHGMVFVSMFVIYPMTRFLLEMIRSDNPHDTFGLTISQGLSVAVIPLAILSMLYLSRLPEISPRAAAELSAKEAKSR